MSTPTELSAQTTTQAAGATLPGGVSFADYEMEVFRIGTYTDSSGKVIKFNPQDVDYAIKNYKPSNFRVPLIVSHDTGGIADRKLPDSELAYGVPESFTRKGDRVYAKFSKIAPQFVDWVRNGQIHSISSSFYLPGSPSSPDPKGLMFRHVAALGKSAPAVKGMEPLKLSEFPCFNEAEAADVVTCTQLITDMTTQAASQPEPVTATVTPTQPAVSDNTAPAETVQLSEENERLRQELLTLRVNARRQEVSSFVELQRAEGRVTPGMLQDLNVEFSDSRQPIETNLVNFMTSLNEQQLEFTKWFIGNLPVQVNRGTVVSNSDFASRTSESAPAMTPKQLADKAKMKRAEAAKSGVTLSETEALDQVLAEYGIAA